MKPATLLIFVLLSLNVFGQNINGPANIRETPNGDVLISLNDYAKIKLEENSGENNWFKIILFCDIKPEDLMNNTIIKANTTLFSAAGDSIGFTTKEFKIRANHSLINRKPDDSGRISISIDGYTYKTNLREEENRDEIVKTKPSYSDSSKSSILQYQNEDGLTVTEIEQCNFYNTSLKFDEQYEDVIVKKIQRIKRTSGQEGQESIIELEIARDYFSESPLIKSLTVNADDVEIGRNVIKAVTYGCCGAEDAYQLYTIKSFKKLMDFDEVLYRVEIPNSKVEGFIGFRFLSYENNKTDIGTLTFCTTDSVVNRVKIVTYNKNIFDNIVPFVPEMEFETTNAKDETDYGTGLTLWSKNKSEDQHDISNFNFLIHFINDATGEDLTQKLEFKNGYINGNPAKECELEIK